MARNPELGSSDGSLGPGRYTEWRASKVGAITDRLERQLILDLVGDVSGRTILDMGCGDGQLAVELWKRDAKVVGVDASTAMIEAARQRAEQYQADLDFRVAVAEHLPFPAERFDVVVVVTVLCFVEDAAPVFREMARVLRPGGRLVVGELGKWSSWAAIRRIRGWLGSPLWRKGRFRTIRELRGPAEQAGLVVETVRGAIYYPRCGLAAQLPSPRRTLAPQPARPRRLRETPSKRRPFAELSDRPRIRRPSHIGGQASPPRRARRRAGLARRGRSQS
ncbi:MAG: class I SAM-dependent methyltransferase [Kiloniellales bacterium]